MRVFLLSLFFFQTGFGKSHEQFDLYHPQDFSYVVRTSKFSEELLKLHLTLYKGYVKNTRELLETLSDMRKNQEETQYEYKALKRRLNFEMSGMRLHEYYFENLGGKGAPDLSSPLMDTIVSQFGSYENWRKDFVSLGMMRGIGWVVLVQDSHTGRLINVWIEEHNFGNLIDLEPLLVMDVWEHAYLTEYGLNRRSYIEAFFRDIHWPVVEKRFNAID